jgi:single-strand DNA-binding protein
MASYNKVLLMGNLTRDPELRYTPSNTAVAAFGIAVNRRWKNQNGEQQEEVTFVDCEAWGRTGEVINQYFKKGAAIFLEGRLKLDQWQDKEGQKRSKMKVVIENFQFIDTRRGEGGHGGGHPGDPSEEGSMAPAPRSAPSRGSSAPRQPAPPPTNPPEEDIPF